MLPENTLFFGGHICLLVENNILMCYKEYRDLYALHCAYILYGDVIMRKRVLIIHTGGTIGMIKTPIGYAPEEGYIKKVLEGLSEIRSAEMPEVELFEIIPLLDSSNIALDEWNRIGKYISERYSEFDGFVVLHGTDTMAYTASALSFMLHNLGKPVVLTGSQIPFSEVRNDARDNLLTALLIAARDDIFEVCLYFAGQLFRGVRATKLSADELVAFVSPNERPLAECGIFIRPDPAVLRNKPTKAFHFRPFAHQNIAVLKIFPGIQFDIFKNIVSDKLGGIVLEAFGSGNVPVNSQNGLLHIIQRARESGTAVVIVTQCLHGTARPGHYSVSAGLREQDIIIGHDMTVEAAVTKLYSLLSEGFRGEKLKHYMETPLCGELTVASKL